MASEPVAALAAIPAGPSLAAALAGLDVDALSGFEAVLVLRAQFRQANHERGRLLGSVVQVLRRTDPGTGVDASWRHGDLRGSAEVRAALVLTRLAAKDLCGLARDLAVRLPAVLDALTAGLVDEARARVFLTFTADLTEQHAAVLVQRLLPRAPRLTVAELIAALQKGAIELDPQWTRRRYERGLGQRRVEGKLRPDGTADLSGYNLPVGRVAIACGRLDTLAHRLKQAGYPGHIDHIRAELFIGKLGGEYTYLDDDEIFTMLMTISQPGWDTEADNPDSEHTDSDRGSDDGSESDDGDGDGPAPGDDPPDPPSGPDSCAGGGVPEDPERPDDAVLRPAAAGWSKGRGLRLLAGLGTIAGCDQRPGQLLGWGYLHAEAVRQIAATPGVSWWSVLTTTEGTPLHVAPIRTRPTQPWTTAPSATAANGEIWLQVTAAELAVLTHDPPPGWRRIITDLAQAMQTPSGAPNGDPTDRLPNAALRRWIGIRDQHCVFPGCRVPPSRCDADHTIEYARGGPTIDAGLASVCRPDHLLRHDGGWQVHQPTPGRVIWTSPLGHTYQKAPAMQPLAPMPDPGTDDINEHDEDDEEDGLPYTRSDTCKIYDPYPRVRPPTPPPPRPEPRDYGDPPF